MKHIALFFGSFNPVHTGHLIIASSVADIAGIDGVWLVVSPHNPLKELSTLAPDHQRLEMARLAVGDDPRIAISDIEFHLSKPSYTIHTLQALADKFPDYRFSLVLGSDILPAFHLWKDYQKIMATAGLIVYPRFAEEKDPGVIQWQGTRLLQIAAPRMEISSTYIRQKIRDGKSIRYLVSPAVEAFIVKHRLYKS
jgi:nicotinate-nucleotide adenylyltransferase